MGRKHQQSKKIAQKQAAGVEGEASDGVVCPESLNQALADTKSAINATGDSVPFDCGALAARALLGLPEALARVVEVLRLGVCDYLDSMSCARVAGIARVPKTIVEAVVAESIARSLKATSIGQDVVDMRHRPLLALSHLESLAQSDLLFRVCRELLKLCSHTAESPKEGYSKPREAVLLEVEGDEDEVFKAIVGLSLGEGESEAEESKLTQAIEQLASEASKTNNTQAATWYSHFCQALHTWVTCGNSQEPVSPVDPNGMLATFLLGVDQLLPQTKVAAQAADGFENKGVASQFLLQAFDRLLFPMSKWTLVCQQVRGDATSKQPCRPPASQIWAFGSDARYYIILLE